MERAQEFPNSHYAIKAAIRRLVHKLGGVEAAALVPGVSFGKSAISNWQNPDQPSMPPLNVIVLWEADVREAIVSNVMAGLLSAASHVAEDPRNRLARLMAELGEAAQAVQSAMADETITEFERRAICKEADDVIEAATKLKRDVRCEAA